MKVIVTRPRAQARPLVERLAALGFEVVLCPLVEIVPLETGPVDTSGYDWVIVTSPNGADLFAQRRTGVLRKLAAVGPGTADALRAHGLRPDLVPPESTQEGLIAELPTPRGRVLFAGAAGSRRDLVDALGADFVPLYETIAVEPDEPPEGDLVVLASGSAARSFARLGLDIPVVSIGPQTTRAAEASGLRVLAQADEHDLEGLVAAVAGVAR